MTAEPLSAANLQVYLQVYARVHPEHPLPHEADQMTTDSNLRCCYEVDGVQQEGSRV
jgi:hypothetical protein